MTTFLNICQITHGWRQRAQYSSNSMAQNVVSTASPSQKNTYNPEHIKGVTMSKTNFEVIEIQKANITVDVSMIASEKNVFQRH